MRIKTLEFQGFVIFEIYRDRMKLKIGGEGGIRTHGEANRNQ
jgi:hypothetical protein